MKEYKVLQIPCFVCSQVLDEKECRNDFTGSSVCIQVFTILWSFFQAVVGLRSLQLQTDTLSHQFTVIVLTVYMFEFKYRCIKELSPSLKTYRFTWLVDRKRNFLYGLMFKMIIDEILKIW